MVVPSADTAIHYTTDASEPTAQSPLYKEPFTIRAMTTIKAIAVRKGERPSGVAKAMFTKGDLPPVISGPVKLPAGKLGQPYSVQFTKEGDRPVVWRLIGHPLGDEGKPGVARPDVMGLDFDPETATLAGTPTRAARSRFRSRLPGATANRPRRGRMCCLWRNERSLPRGCRRPGTRSPQAGRPALAPSGDRRFVPPKVHEPLFGRRPGEGTELRSGSGGIVSIYRVASMPSLGRSSRQ